MINQCFFCDHDRGPLADKPTECEGCQGRNFQVKKSMVPRMAYEYFKKKKEDAMMYKRYPYVNNEADAYVTAINILAVEYLVKTYDYEEYSRRVHQIGELTEIELSVLYIDLSLNMHTSSLGAMITQGDYEKQRERLLYFLDHPEDRF